MIMMFSRSRKCAKIKRPVGPQLATRRHQPRDTDDSTPWTKTDEQKGSYFTLE
jgi:hypothetical protein